MQNKYNCEHHQKNSSPNKSFKEVLQQNHENFDAQDIIKKFFCRDDQQNKSFNESFNKNHYNNNNDYTSFMDNYPINDYRQMPKEQVKKEVESQLAISQYMKGSQMNNISTIDNNNNEKQSIIVHQTSKNSILSKNYKTNDNLKMSNLNSHSLVISPNKNQELLKNLSLLSPAQKKQQNNLKENQNQQAHEKPLNETNSGIKTLPKQQMIINNQNNVNDNIMNNNTFSMTQRSFRSQQQKNNQSFKNYNRYSGVHQNKNKKLLINSIEINQEDSNDFIQDFIPEHNRQSSIFIKEDPNYKCVYCDKQIAKTNQPFHEPVCLKEYKIQKINGNIQFLMRKVQEMYHQYKFTSFKNRKNDHMYNFITESLQDLYKAVQNSQAQDVVEEVKLMILRVQHKEKNIIYPHFVIDLKNILQLASDKSNVLK